MVDLFLNELSINELLPSRDKADEVMAQFVSVLRQVRSLGVKPIVRSHVTLKAIELADNYFISNWCTNQLINKEMRLYVQTLLTKSPILVELPKEIEEESKEVAVHYNSQVGQGLTVAYITDNPIISFHSHENWSPTEIPVIVEYIHFNSNENTSEIKTLGSTLINFCSAESVESSRSQITDLLLYRFNSGDDFWTRKEHLFTQLEFSPDLKKVFIDLHHKSDLFSQAIKKFRQLNDYCSKWDSGPCLVKDLIPNVSDESETTLQQFSEQRKFSDQAGNFHLCSLHARLTPGPWRIHFAILNQTKKIFIGYVGEKLQSTKYRT